MVIRITGSHANLVFFYIISIGKTFFFIYVTEKRENGTFFFVYLNQSAYLCIVKMKKI
jgi:hypothetical protein